MACFCGNTGTPYQSEWAEYRRRRRLFWGLWLTYLPAMMVVAGVFGRSTHALTILGVAWMTAFALAASRMVRWRCPRCRKPFVGGWSGPRPWARKCACCQLPTWSGSTFKRSF